MNIANCHLTEDRILIKEVDQQELESGIVLPQNSSKEGSQKGVVVLVGPGKRGEEGKIFPITVKKGDYVFFAKYAGSKITISGEDYLCMRESEVLLFMRDEKK